MYNTVLLKLSGEAIAEKGFPFSIDTLDYLAKQIKALVKKGVKVGIVVGGGNMCRGRQFKTLGIKQERADYIGMCATVMNAQMLGAALTKNKVDNVVFTTFPVNKVLNYDPKKANSYLKKGYVCVFGGGTGKPFFSTDTACALRATDIKADAILFAKNGTNGVYDSDPNKNPNAKRYETLSYNDIIKNKLEVIDLAAAKILKKNNIEGFVFDMAEKDAIKKSVNHKVTGTVIK
ncbi:MAG: UMP kinase [Erysipelotrichaceae bacterium]|nr:UMP kinase [Erysipelotrichaceae bacterium]